MLRVATVFSGIGAVEYALRKMNLEHKIVFACDNGEVELFNRKLKEDKEPLVEELSTIEGMLHGIGVRYYFPIHVGMFLGDVSLCLWTSFLAIFEFSPHKWGCFFFISLKQADIFVHISFFIFTKSSTFVILFSYNSTRRLGFTIPSSAQPLIGHNFQMKIDALF